MPRTSAASAQIWVAVIGAAAAVIVALITSGALTVRPDKPPANSGSDADVAKKPDAPLFPITIFRMPQFADPSSEFSESAMRIRKWLYPGAVMFDEAGAARDATGNSMLLDAGRLQELKKEMKSIGIDEVPMAAFLGSRDYAVLRQRAIEELKIPDP